MRIALASPVRPSETSGNDVTAARWARRLRELGHTVVDVPTAEGSAVNIEGLDADVLIGLHARRCAEPIRAWADRHPDRPLIVGLAGTDLYRDLPVDESARHSIEVATKVVVLQAGALERMRRIAPDVDTAVIHQSVEPPLPPADPPDAPFTVAVLAHLRDVKDPLMAARAVARLPRDRAVLVRHAGAAHSADWAGRARAEAVTNARYRYLGALSRPQALGLLARSHVLACTSAMEGGANVVGEAIAIGVPVVGTDIEGNTGLLGADYPGLVPVGDDAALGRLLTTLADDDEALERLRTLVVARQPLFDPEAERRSWADLLAGL